LERTQRRLRMIDCYHIFITISMVILGAIIIFRSLGEKWFLNSIIIGGSILIFGIYRVVLVFRYIKERKDVC
jgi:hypothetical protein